jgi:hypothetical protein
LCPQNLIIKFTMVKTITMAKKNTKLILPDEIIISKIYLLRDKKVMLDHDLAKLYNVETKVLKQSVRRNIRRFPDDFMFELNK